HQAQAAEAAHEGSNVVLATGTSSGKSLAFTLPAMARIVSGGGTRKEPTALYIAPTKALADLLIPRKCSNAIAT
ncbi:MAG: DEAD/DEAH box helicase, partial [Limnohabitans sp.]|nr:DEAD/DEAH box helicase [Limnohabitans sp.]